MGSPRGRSRPTGGHRWGWCPRRSRRQAARAGVVGPSVGPGAAGAEAGGASEVGDRALERGPFRGVGEAVGDPARQGRDLGLDRPGSDLRLDLADQPADEVAVEVGQPSRLGGARSGRRGSRPPAGHRRRLSPSRAGSSRASMARFRESSSSASSRAASGPGWSLTNATDELLGLGPAARGDGLAGDLDGSGGLVVLGLGLAFPRPRASPGPGRSGRAWGRRAARSGWRSWRRPRPGRRRRRSAGPGRDQAACDPGRRGRTRPGTTGRRSP